MQSMIVKGSACITFLGFDVFGVILRVWIGLVKIKEKCYCSNSDYQIEPGISLQMSLNALKHCTCAKLGMNTSSDYL